MWSAAAGFVACNIATGGTLDSPEESVAESTSTSASGSGGGSTAETTVGAGGFGEGTACSRAGEVRACGHVEHRQDSYLECAFGTQTCDGADWGACTIDKYASTYNFQADAGPCTNNPCDPNCEVFTDTAIGLDAGTNVGLTIDGGVALTPGPCMGTGLQPRRYV